MSIASTLTALCEMLRDSTGAEVVLGRPQDSPAAIYVWPWRLENNPYRRNEPVSGRSPGNPPPVAPAANVQFLVVAAPALTTESLSRLDKVRQALLDNAVLNVDGAQARVVPDDLDAEELKSLFRAAGIPLTLCVGAKVEIVGR